MAITLELEPEVESRLEKKAKDKGFEIEVYVKKLIEKDVSPEALNEILAPVRKEFQESGMTEDELDDFLYSARRESKAGEQTLPETK